MIAMTTSSSIRVKPVLRRDLMPCLLCEARPAPQWHRALVLPAIRRLAGRFLSRRVACVGAAVMRDTFQGCARWPAGPWIVLISSADTLRTLFGLKTWV